MLQVREALRVPSTGGDVERFERAATAALGLETSAFGSARTGIWAVLRATPALRRVWVPAYTCVAVPNAVEAAGLEIRWVDVVGANIDLRVVLREARPGDAVIAQHTYGIPPDPQALVAARKQGVFVIEDRAHRFDADEMLGDAAVFSLEHSKVISAGQGGLVYYADADGRKRLRAIRRRLVPISNADAARTVITSVGQIVFDWRAPFASSVGSLARRTLLRIPASSVKAQTQSELRGLGIAPVAMNPLLARIGTVSVHHAAATLLHRAAVTRRYASVLGRVTPPWVTTDRPLVRYPVLTPDADVAWRLIRANGIDLGPRWFDAPVHPRGSASSYMTGSAPRGEELSRQILTLPTHPRVSLDDVDDVAAVVLGVLGNLQ